MPDSYLKDPQAVLDYGVDWSLWLAGGETISTSTFTVDAGLTKNSQTNTTVSATVWLSGGTIGQRYKVVNEITTTAGRTNDATFTVIVNDR